jgi:hypothetical protein
MGSSSDMQLARTSVKYQWRIPAKGPLHVSAFNKLSRIVEEDPSELFTSCSILHDCELIRPAGLQLCEICVHGRARLFVRPLLGH